MRKRKTAGIRPRRAYRLPRRRTSALFDHVLKVVNGDVKRPERYEPDRSEIREILDSIIKCCDQTEDALFGFDHFNRIVVAIPTRRERIIRAMTIAAGLPRLCSRGKTFTVTVTPSRSLEKHIEGSWKPTKLPPAEELFRLNDLLVRPDGGDICVQLWWEFYQGLLQVDDLRRLRRCAGYLHTGPFYFVRKNVRREKDGHYFCDDPCRSDFNYKHSIEAQGNESRKAAK